jgi:hypothetical protein
MGPTFHQKFYYIMVVKVNGIQQWGNSISITKHRVKMKTTPEEERDHLGDLSIDGKKILTLILKKECMRIWNGFNWLRVRSSVMYMA